MAGGRRKYEPTDKDIRIVEAMARCGMPQDAIARVLGIDGKTLRKHFRVELDTSADKANAAVANKAYQMAVTGSPPAATFFWLKCHGWRETSRVEHTGPGGRSLVPIETARALLKDGVSSRPPEDEDEKPIKK
jgi:hypothetical protein